METFDKAYEIVLASATALSNERVGLADALGRVLAEDVVSDIDMPPFDKSAMDGFACRRSDLGNKLEVVETIAAGYTPRKSIGPNQCARIMTGAVVPEGADCVIMKEYVETHTESTIRFVGEKIADNICRKGEDVRAGEVVLRKGTRIGPQHIAVLASVGQAEPLVSKRPRVGVIATGDELVEPGATPGPSQIRNSNSFQLATQVEKAGAVVTNYGIAKDTRGNIDSMLKRALDENDVVLVSGGVSVGDFDLVPGILKQNNVKLMFEKIAVKPGRPTVFGISEKGYCFGLPGNPVSSFVLFELLVKPFLFKLMGCEYRAAAFSAPLAKTVLRKKADRDSWMPVVLTESYEAAPVEYHGSAHINALCNAQGLICVPVGTTEIQKGAIVTIRQI